ncbi:MFS transporter, partial [Rhodococcus sp. NPDC056960]|uniref:MFS transporter n=1 Tax=Rhodococcus sp. NPDC056960 TaxID=3345982 RepID=UPI003633BC92
MPRGGPNPTTDSYRFGLSMGYDLTHNLDEIRRLPRELQRELDCSSEHYVGWDEIHGSTRARLHVHRRRPSDPRLTTKSETFMTETHQGAGLGSEAPTHRAPNKAVLIGVGTLLVVLTNAIIFILPPLLPTIQAQYGLATVAATTWLYTALTLGGGASFILLPRLADLHGDRNAAVAASALLAVGALIPAVGDSYPTVLVGCALMGFGGAAQLLPLGFLRRNLGEDGISVGVAVLFIATGVGIVVGMIGGGFIVESLSLRGFFVILTAVCAATTIACYVSIPHAPPAERGGRIAVLGTV